MRLLAFASFLTTIITSTAASENAGLQPPGLAPLIARANALFSSGQFNEASKAFSEAIDQSPADYLLYYKRATSYYSLNRHSAALGDFEKVLSLTSNTFDNAHLMKARIHLKDGDFELAQDSLAHYTKSKTDSSGTALQAQISEGKQMAGKMDRERRAQLWTACVDSASAALRYASHSVHIRQTRAECSLASGDVESTVGDLTRLTHLLPPTTSILSRIFRMSYFLLPPNPAAMNSLKQCLHYDPDSKPCLVLHRLSKSFEKGFAKLEELQAKEDWRAITQLLTAPGKNNDLMNRFDQALTDHASRESLLPPEPVSPSPTTTTGSTAAAGSKPNKPADLPVPIPDAFKSSPRRQTLVRVLCQSYTRLNNLPKVEIWCQELSQLDGCEDDVDALVGKGEVLLKKQEWEEAVRVLGDAFEKSGRSDRDIHSRLQRAQKLLKQSKQKDYYKVLGVSRDADTRTIKKAFRNAAKIAHPDKGGSEAKMAAVNEAYEVLNNPELRERFDNGEDPNDPMSNQGGNPFGGSGHPFAQFFQQSPPGHHGGFHQSGGFQFHF
ncbi:hypothetical protein BDN72DRAFT_141582 [Pluteus cervinus]|uniref:Uncharacterized protein n=1 Tax=Pluteus cervinus TaxID=181527 RepID=A0ACD3AKY4_9AGAR|nr:hypothetical protein BDN72DRAFT_141582 [Pluteus cervinus]